MPSPSPLRRRPSLGLRAVMACVREEEREEHNGTFSVIRDAVRPWSPTRPLVIVVHPGDAVEHPLVWSPADRPAVLRVSLAAQTGMAQELAHARQAHADTVVLHRRSSDLVVRDQNASWQAPAYRNEVQQLGRSGALLYGDDLEVAAAWIAEHVPLADRPSVLLTGAYSDRDHGCITAIGQALQARFPHLSVTLSAHAPSSPLNDTPQWVPRPPVEALRSTQNAAPPSSVTGPAPAPRRRVVR